MVKFLYIWRTKQYIKNLGDGAGCPVTFVVDKCLTLFTRIAPKKKSHSEDLIYLNALSSVPWFNLYMYQNVQTFLSIFVEVIEVKLNSLHMLVI